MKIYRIIDRYEDDFRLEVKATESMNQGWLKKLNECYTDNKKYNSFEEAINCPHQCYLSNDNGFLIMEIIRNIMENTTFVVAKTGLLLTSLEQDMNYKRKKYPNEDIKTQFIEETKNLLNINDSKLEKNMSIFDMEKYYLFIPTVKKQEEGASYGKY